MVLYPVNIPISPKLAKSLSWELARRYRKQIQGYLNKRAKDSPETVLTYPQIAEGTSLDTDTVRLFLRPLTGSYSGITIVNPDLKNETGS